MNMKYISTVLDCFELILKALISLSVAVVVLFCFIVWRGGHFPGKGEEILPIYSFDDGESCITQNEKLAVLGEDVKTSFLRLFVNGPYGIYRVYKIFYVNSKEEKIHIATYEFPLTLGIGAIDEDTELFAETSHDVIKIYYTDEPVKSFTIEKNPFSKKILFVRKGDLSNLRKACAKGVARD